MLLTANRGDGINTWTRLLKSCAGVFELAVELLSKGWLNGWPVSRRQKWHKTVRASNCVIA